MPSLWWKITLDLQSDTNHKQTGWPNALQTDLQVTFWSKIRVTFYSLRPDIKTNTFYSFRALRNIPTVCAFRHVISRERSLIGFAKTVYQPNWNQQLQNLGTFEVTLRQIIQIFVYFGSSSMTSPLGVNELLRISLRPLDRFLIKLYVRLR